MRILNGRAYNADCFDILKDIPNGSIDCVITDPPYNIGGSLFQYRNRKT